MKKIFMLFATLLCCFVMFANDFFVSTNAGELKNALGFYDCSQIKSLTIAGEMDASDFNFIKWNCINLEYLDLSNVTIIKYEGQYGTNEGYHSVYSANEIPMGAFFYWMVHFENGRQITNRKEYYDEGMPSLKVVKLPNGIKAIRRNTFSRAYNLKEINIPEGVELIDYVSFRYCTSLEEITIPSTIKEIGLWAFTAMPSLRAVHCKATTPPVTNQSFGTIYDSDNRGQVMSYTYKNTKFSTLYVPKGCKKAYESWNTYFENIIEE